MEIILIDKKLSPLFDECIAASALERAEALTTLALGAVDSESRLPMGAMLASFFEKSVYIDWLYILPEYRNRGAASALVGRLALMLSGRGDIEQIVAAFPKSSENAALEDFFRSLGFCVTQTEGQSYYFTPAQLSQAEFWKAPSGSESIMSLEQLWDASLRELSGVLREKGVSAVKLPIRRDAYDHALSAFGVKGGQIATLLLASRTAFGYELSFVFSDNAGAELRELLNYVGRLAIEKLPPDTMITVSAINDSAKALLEGLLPELEPVKEVYAAVNVIREEGSRL